MCLLEGSLDWFEVLGYRVIEDKTTDYAHLKQALSEQFPVVKNSTMGHGSREIFYSGGGIPQLFSYRPRQKMKDRVVTAQGAPCSHLGLFSDQPGLTHVVYHEIDTGDKGPVVSRPYKYDRVKQGIIDYHIDKMLQDGTICPINSPYASPVVLTRKNNDLPPDSPRRRIVSRSIIGN
ncbi:retrovirus-related Pol polyprotein from transposon 17.6 [Trichonephila clavipes]|nr:retrovirus-related Pol polyprotein from transposon 17.6 [Trichonephila clavipes]